MKLQRKIIFLILLSVVANAFAEVDKHNIYQIQVEVDDQGGSQRQRGFRLALQKVLVKLTGNRQLKRNKQLANLIRRPSQFVQRFSYLQEERRIDDSVVIEPDLNGSESPEMSRQWLMDVSFERTMINRVLQDAGIPIWGDSRSELLIWLAVDDGIHRELLNDTDSQALQSLNDTAEERGIPIFFPLLDLEDQRRVSISEVWGGFAEDVMAASQRYGTSTVLVGRVYQARRDWRARWILVDGGKQQWWNFRGETKDAVLAQGIHSVSDRIARKYAVLYTNDDQNTYPILIDSVTGFEDYALVIKHLESLDIVQQVQPVAVQDDKLELKLLLNASLDHLPQAIRSGLLLEAVPSERGAELIMRFHLNKEG